MKGKSTYTSLSNRKHQAQTRNKKSLNPSASVQTLASSQRGGSSTKSSAGKETIFSQNAVSDY